jgi:hypothetical protein
MSKRIDVNKVSFEDEYINEDLKVLEFNSEAMIREVQELYKTQVIPTQPTPATEQN